MARRARIWRFVKFSLESLTRFTSIVNRHNRGQFHKVSFNLFKGGSAEFCDWLSFFVTSGSNQSGLRYKTNHNLTASPTLFADCMVFFALIFDWLISLFPAQPTALGQTDLKKRSFTSTNPPWKRSSNRRNLKTPGFRFHVNGKHFEGAAFWNRWRQKYSRDFPARVFLKHKSKLIGDCCVFKFLWRRVDEKHLVRFQSETSIFKFLQRCVDWA